MSATTQNKGGEALEMLKSDIALASSYLRTMGSHLSSDSRSGKSRELQADMARYWLNDLRVASAVFKDLALPSTYRLHYVVAKSLRVVSYSRNSLEVVSVVDTEEATEGAKLAMPLSRQYDEILGMPSTTVDLPSVPRTLEYLTLPVIGAEVHGRVNIIDLAVDISHHPHGGNNGFTVEEASED